MNKPECEREGQNTIKNNFYSRHSKENENGVMSDTHFSRKKNVLIDKEIDWHYDLADEEP